MHGRSIGLEMTELLLLLGIQAPFTTSLLLRSWKERSLLGIPKVLARLGGMPSAIYGLCLELDITKRTIALSPIASERSLCGLSNLVSAD